jgi:CP family cyanate transporter-like MFS transporter
MTFHPHPSIQASSHPQRDPSWIVVLAGVAAALHVVKLPSALPVLQPTPGLSLAQSGFLVLLV